MKYIVAVSGGVDSVVLLAMLLETYAPDELLVAHFDHGIRGEDSAADARFVEKLSQKYRVKVVIKQGNLTKQTSEAAAREHRYAFLRDVAKRHHARIATAHHQDDVAETIAINLLRGTGWRGCAVLAAHDIDRPLLTWRKAELYKYALKHNLEYVEDATNASQTYLRNRLRHRLQLDDQTTRQLLALRNHQLDLKRAIDQQLQPLQAVESRYVMTMIADEVALEILRQQTNGDCVVAQLQYGLHAIKTWQPGKTAELGGGWRLQLGKRTYSVKNYQR